MAERGNSASLTRRYNRLVVLDALRRFGTLSRVELARDSGLTPQAIANIIADLEAGGMVRQTGRRRGQRGQPQINIELDLDHSYAVGMHVEGRRCSAIAINMVGDVLDEADCGEAGTPSEIAGILRQALDRFARTRASARCLGTGLVTSTPYELEWPQPEGPVTLSGAHLAAALRAEHGLEVATDNDANAAAVAEMLYGAARGLDAFAYVFIGDGVGGAAVLGGEPWRGLRGNAGEFGHIVVDPRGPRCRCGRAGCLDGVLSLSSLRAANHGQLPGSALQIPPAWQAQAVAGLAQAVATLENIFDPGRVILGGVAPQWLVEHLVASVHLPPSVRSAGSPVRLAPGALGPRGALLGAAALPILSATSPNPQSLTKAV